MDVTQSPGARVGRALRRAAVAALVATLLAGCSGDDGDPGHSVPAPAATAPLAGTCFDGATLDDQDALALIGELDTLAVTEVRALPTYADPVACDEPHRLEVYAVVDAPKGARDYAAALDPDADRYQAIRSAVAAACREEADPALSAAADASPLDVIPHPAFVADIRTTFVPFPYADWQAGERRFACVLRQETPRSVRYADFQAPALDPTLRVCLDADLTTVACDTSHTREQLLVLTATPAVAAGQLPGRKAIKEDDGGRYVDLRPEAFQLLDDECAAYFALLANEPATGLTAVSEIYPELWGDEAGEYSAVCTVSSPLDVARDQMVVTDRSVVD
ncbi:hypothetical protein [Nocardioides daejeonensis]|uniref:hypothetical protein n=1 Tax=Nocardioides daejeonensis TaxID=1046556 RepID=UPI0013A5584A|nr:hypothetical protein [Nocardioides daejeonensis]